LPSGSCCPAGILASCSSDAVPGTSSDAVLELASAADELAVAAAEAAGCEVPAVIAAVCAEEDSEEPEALGGDCRPHAPRDRAATRARSGPRRHRDVPAAEGGERRAKVTPFASRREARTGCPSPSFIRECALSASLERRRRGCACPRGSGASQWWSSSLRCDSRACPVRRRRNGRRLRNPAAA
jgi:hypothetical protein